MQLRDYSSPVHASVPRLPVPRNDRLRVFKGGFFSFFSLFPFLFLLSFEKNSKAKFSREEDRFLGRSRKYGILLGTVSFHHCDG